MIIGDTTTIERFQWNNLVFSIIDKSCMNKEP